MNDALKSLHTTLIDAEKGYETAIADAATPETRIIFERMQNLHARAHRDVHAMITARGEHPDESGSFLSVVHKTVISVRSAVKGLDSTALPSFIDGEERILGVYDEAIAEIGEPEADKLTGHKNALLAAIADMKARAA